MLLKTPKIHPTKSPKILILGVICSRRIPVILTSVYSYSHKIALQNSSLMFHISYKSPDPFLKDLTTVVKTHDF